MKASELVGSDFRKVLIYGDAGTGKTCFAASFPTPIEIWDFDNKASSIVNYYNGDKRLEQIEVKQYGHLQNGPKIKAWEADYAKLHDKVKSGEIKTVILDSLTTFASALLQHYIVTQTSIKRAIVGINALQDYQLLDAHLTQIITSILGLNCNVVMTGHLTMEKDEATGAIQRVPLMSGKFAYKLPIFFEEVYVSKIEKGNYVAVTKTDSTYISRTQIKGLPTVIPLKYDELIKQR